MKTIIGIDPGLRNTAFAVLRDGEIELVEIINTNPKTLFGERLLKLYDAIDHNVYYQQKPDIVAVEGIFFAPRVGSSYLQTAAVIGLIEMLGYEYKTEVRQLSPPTIKKFVTGNGRAKKDDMMAAMQERYGKSVVKNHHCADAIAVTLTLESQLQEKDEC